MIVNSLFDTPFVNIITDSQATGLTLGQLLAGMGTALAIGFAISLVYIITHKKTGYNASYIWSILFLPPIVALMIMVVGDNTGAALGTLGVFSLVRFRSVPGDPKDIAYLFFALGSGLACGMGYLFYAAVFGVLICAVACLVSFARYGEPKTAHMVLKVTVPENMNYRGRFDTVLDKYAVSWHFHRVKTVDFGSLFEVVYYMELKNDIDEKAFLDEVRTLNGNLTVVLIVREFDDKVYER